MSACQTYSYSVSELDATSCARKPLLPMVKASSCEASFAKLETVSPSEMRWLRYVESHVALESTKCTHSSSNSTVDESESDEASSNDADKVQNTSSSGSSTVDDSETESSALVTDSDEPGEPDSPICLPQQPADIPWANLGKSTLSASELRWLAHVEKQDSLVNVETPRGRQMTTAAEQHEYDWAAPDDHCPAATNPSGLPPSFPKTSNLAAESVRTSPAYNVRVSDGALPVFAFSAEQAALFRAVGPPPGLPPLEMQTVVPRQKTALVLETEVPRQKTALVPRQKTALRTQAAAFVPRFSWT